jgi:3-deoxy-D-manno-octulosonic-acid transferase
MLTHDIYNIFIESFNVIICLSEKFRIPLNNKIQRFVRGQRNILSVIEQETSEYSGKTYWVHASSYGEYNIIKPVLKRLRESEKCRIVFTFFSPTGIELLKNKKPEITFIDRMFYLPVDTPRNAKEFIKIVKPDKAIFVVSEIWVNYLEELRNKQIPTFLISAIVTKKSALFRWYGGFFRHAVSLFSEILVLNERSRRLLASIGINDVIVNGDPLFDNAIDVSKQPYNNPIIDRFKKSAQNGIFIAGSISDINDLRIVCGLANRHKDLKCIFVPHEISDENLKTLISNLEGKSMLYSDCDETTMFLDTQVLIIDFLGALSKIYRYGKWAYVGGGFTPYLHSVIEATVYGLPVAFGPKTDRKVTPMQLIEYGIGAVVNNKNDLDRWYMSLIKDAERMEVIKNNAMKYIHSNVGATEQVVNIIRGEQ